MIRITTGGSTARVAFPYDAEAVAIVKSIPGRRWDPERRHWTIDAGDARIAAERFVRAGYAVQLDGRPFEATTQQSTRSPNVGPFLALFTILPKHLRTPVYRALSRVLHPDAGGDTSLMQQLNQAKERHP